MGAHSILSMSWSQSSWELGDLGPGTRPQISQELTAVLHDNPGQPKMEYGVPFRSLDAVIVFWLT